MITLFELYKQKPEIDDKTIRAYFKVSTAYVDFYFDSKNRIDYIDNKWDMPVPEWYGVTIDINNIKNWAHAYTFPNFGYEVYYLLDHDAKKYNL